MTVVKHMKWFNLLVLISLLALAFAGTALAAPEASPDAPVLVAPANGGTGVVTWPWLQVTVSDPDNDPLTVTFYGQAAGGGFSLLGSAVVASGATAELRWTSLAYSTAHDWFVEVSDGANTTTGPVWSFTTAAQPTDVYVDDGFTAARPNWGYNEFAAITPAVPVVAPYGRLHVTDGVYTEDVTLNRPRITIMLDGNVTINGFLIILQGNFRSTPGNLTLTGDFQVSAGSIFQANSGTVVFGGGDVQELFSTVPTLILHGVVVGPGTTLINSANVTFTSLVNQGSIQETVTVGGVGIYTFPMCMVSIAVWEPADITTLEVTRHEVDHPYANTDNTRTGRWWSINAPGDPTPSGYDMEFTFPHNNLYDPRICLWVNGPGAGFDCARESYTSQTVTRVGITELSQWTVSTNTNPTAVRLQDLKAYSQTSTWLLVAGLGLLALPLLWLLRRKIMAR